MHRSSQRDNNLSVITAPVVFLQRVLFFGELRRPRNVVAAVTAKNSPPDCFNNAATVLKEITNYLFSSTRCIFTAGAFLRQGIESFDMDRYLQDNFHIG